MQGETGLIFPRNCQAYCTYVWSMCQLVSPVLFRTGLLTSHKFIRSDLPLDIRYRPLNRLENCASFCCPEVLGDCRDKGQLSHVLLNIAYTKCCFCIFFGLGIGDYVRAPIQNVNTKAFAEQYCLSCFCPVTCILTLKCTSTNSLILSTPVDFRGEDAGDLVFAQPSPLELRYVESEALSFLSFE